MDMFAKKTISSKECITPHKISLLVLISELCDRTKDDEITPFRKHRHALMLLILNLMQTTDTEFIGLRRKLDEIDERQGQLSALLLDRLNSISDGESSLCDFFFQNLDDLLNVEEEIVLTRTSFFGIFVRKMVLLFNKMSFGQVLHLTTLMKSYLQAAHVYCDSNADIDMLLNGEVFAQKIPMSSRQRENFLAKQAALIQSNEQAAESPTKLQQHIFTLLRGAPDLAEAHFVQYLNCIRVGEFNQAMDCLYHYFDRKQWEEGGKTAASGETEDAKKDRCRRFCYAALNLAILHSHFGHRKQALTVLQESIRIAHESNDHVCLAHGLRLLYKLEQEGESQAKHILQRFRARASELKLPYLESLSLLMKTSQMIFEGEAPPRVLGIFNELNILNSEKGLLDLAATTHIQQTACLQFYGQSAMAVVYSQFPLHQWKPSLTGAHVDKVKGTGMINSEAKLHAICFLASHVYNQGNFCGSMKLLEFAKSICPENSKDSKVWQAQKQKIIFDQALVMEDWQTASETAENLKVFDEFEAGLRKARLNTKLKQFKAAHEMLRKLLDYSESDSEAVQNDKSSQEMKANVFLAMAEVYMAAEDYPSSMTHLLKCKTICDSYHMENLSIIVSHHIGEVQLGLGLPDKALSSLRQIMIRALSNGALFTTCCTKLLLTRCQLQQSQLRSREDRKAVLLSILPTLDMILKDFKQMNATAKIREVLLWQAFIYNELGYMEKRNQCSMEFRCLHTTDGKIITRRLSTLLPK